MHLNGCLYSPVEFQQCPILQSKFPPQQSEIAANFKFISLFPNHLSFSVFNRNLGGFENYIITIKSYRT